MGRPSGCSLFYCRYGCLRCQSCCCWLSGRYFWPFAGVWARRPTVCRGSSRPHLSHGWLRSPRCWLYCPRCAVWRLPRWISAVPWWCCLRLVLLLYLLYCPVCPFSMSYVASMLVLCLHSRHRLLARCALLSSPQGPSVLTSDEVLWKS